LSTRTSGTPLPWPRSSRHAQQAPKNFLPSQGRGWRIGASLAREELAQPGLVEHLGAEFLGLGELRAGAVAGDDVVGALGDRAGHLPPRAPDHRRRLLARHVRKRPGEDERSPLERPALGPPLLSGELESQAPLAQAADELE